MISIDFIKGISLFFGSVKNIGDLFLLDLNIKRIKYKLDKKYKIQLDYLAPE